MDLQGKKHNLVFSVKDTTFLYILFIVLLFLLAYSIWPRYTADQFTIYRYTLDYNFIKLCVCILFSIIIWCIVNNRYSANTSFSERVILLLSMLYFIPGLAICSALNIEWKYIIAFFVYFLILILSDYCIKHPQKSFNPIKTKAASFIVYGLIAISLLYPLVMMGVYSKSFSLDNFIYTLNDPYGVRAQAREKSISWAFMLIEYWGVYFGAIMITHSLRQNRRLLAVLFIIIEMFYFSLQGNRIIIFIAGVAIVLGLFKVSNKSVAIIFVLLLIMQFFEYALFYNSESLGIVVNVFRRFSIVPNIISPKYFDFFQTHTPDYLRGHFPNLCALLGTSSEYNFDIGYTIGQQYFGKYLNANTGLVGGAFFEFGYLGVVIDPIMFVISLRLFEKVLKNASEEIVMIVALIYSSLAINSWAIWSQCIRISYIPLLIISIYLLFNRKDSTGYV